LVGWWLLVPIEDMDRTIDRARSRGAGGYADDPWVRSPFMEYLKEWWPGGGPVYSNHSAPVAYLADLPARTVPFAGNERTLAEFGTMVQAATEPVYVVWFTIGGERTSRVSREVLETVVDLVPVATGEDGVIYQAVPDGSAQTGTT
jgi:hypothetical protein